MKIHAVYFSATETTKKNVLAAANAFGLPVNEVDVTLPGEYNLAFGEDDVVVMGAPCYGGRMPIVAAERLGHIRGHKTPLIAVITYGNRDFDDALLEMADMARANGFIPFAAAAVIGQHTFGEVAVGRPNEDDLKLVRDFAEKAAEKLKNGDIADIGPSIPGNKPYKDGGKGGSFRPSTLDTCVSCGLCAAQCPTGAIGDDYRTIDDSKCISCFRCIRVCPVGAKVMDTDAYKEFAAGFSLMLAEPKQNRFFI